MHWLSEYLPRSVSKTRCCCTTVTQEKALNLHGPKCRKFCTDVTATATQMSQALMPAYWMIITLPLSAISKDHCYTEPWTKLSVLDSRSLITEMDVFYMPDRLKPTAMGLDAVPAWFLQLGAPGLLPLLPPSLTNPSLLMCYHSHYYTSPKNYQAFSRLTERYIVRSFIYPALLHPPP